MIYLAAPYSTGIGSDTESAALIMRARADRIDREAAKLMAEGHAVYSPITHGRPLERHLPGDLAADHKFWMAHCKAILAKCDALLVLKLDGWDVSRGVAEEIEHAARLGIPTAYLEAV